jgi:hypothetical protein
MTGDWAYDALVPIAGLEVTILGLAVTSSIIRRRHGLVPLRCHNLRPGIGMTTRFLQISVFALPLGGNPPPGHQGNVCSII